MSRYVYRLIGQKSLVESATQHMSSTAQTRWVCHALVLRTANKYPPISADFVNLAVL